VLEVCAEFNGCSDFALRIGCAKFDKRIESFGRRLSWRGELSPALFKFGLERTNERRALGDCSTLHEILPNSRRASSCCPDLWQRARGAGSGAKLGVGADNAVPGSAGRRSPRLAIDNEFGAAQ
jgi:hypothetical protein